MNQHNKKITKIKDKPSDVVAESVAINNTNNTTDYSSSLDDDVIVAINSGNDKESLHTCIKQSFDLTSKVKLAYRKDKLYSKILEKLKAHALFGCKDSLVFTKNLLKRMYYVYPVTPSWKEGNWSQSSLIMRTP